MKPPQRRRSAPARYLGEVTGPVPWSLREKRQLLRLLQARRGQPEPDPAELARELWSRSEAEVSRGPPWGGGGAWGRGSAGLGAGLRQELRGLIGRVEGRGLGAGRARIGAGRAGMPGAGACGPCRKHSCAGGHEDEVS